MLCSPPRLNNSRVHCLIDASQKTIAAAASCLTCDTQIDGIDVSISELNGFFHDLYADGVSVGRERVILERQIGKFVLLKLVYIDENAGNDTLTRTRQYVIHSAKFQMGLN